jgi:predicted ATPase/class 3 adenylate cyclase
LTSTVTERPTGTVTFLFTDIEGSTRLLHELGDRYAGTLDTHRQVLRDVFARHDGHEVDTQGDAFFVAFARARNAVTAAAEAQRALAEQSWPEGRAFRVRIGIHTAEATPTAEGYVGVGVHRGARICVAGHGGQVLVSHTTRDLVAEEPGLMLTLRELGEHRLKDLTEPQRLYQLAGDGLATEFPPLRTLENRPTNLPAQPTPLVGRERELGEVRALVRRDDVKLATLTGPGGTGKTRLALQSAADLVDEFPGGVFFVELAPIADPGLVVPAIAQAVGINEAGGQSLPGYLADRTLLLLLDNFEQVLGAAPAVAELIASAPGLALLATSREPLRISGEHVFPVPPLADDEAIELFVERGKAVASGFRLTNDNADAIADTCRRLDGLPLALELAAARLTLRSPEAMLARLDQRLKLLTGGARDVPARQRTLRATIEWSYDLLEEEERRLFTTLAVFAGGFTLEAAETVCDAELDRLASLVDKSLVRRDGDRFLVLETLREFALEQLAASGTAPQIRERHAAYSLELAEAAYAERIEKEAEWAQRLEHEHDNLRAALDWFADEDPTRLLELAGALGWFWRAGSHMSEGRDRLAGAIAETEVRDRMRARALTGAGTLAGWQGDLEQARPLLEEAIALWRGLGDVSEEGLAYESLAWGWFFVGDDAAAREAAERSLELQRGGGNKRLVNRAQLAVCQVMVSQGDLDPAERLSREALALAEEQDDAWARHLAEHFLADCALIGGEYDVAEERYKRSLSAALALGDRSEVGFELQGVAMSAAGRSRPRRALRLAAAAQAEHDALGVDYSGVAFWTALLDKHDRLAREQLGAEAAAAWEEGSTMGFERAVEDALNVGEG